MYKGYTNRETWNVVTLFVNDEELYYLIKEHGPFTAPQARSIVCNYISDVSDVNFVEVATYFNDSI